MTRRLQVSNSDEFLELSDSDDDESAPIGCVGSPRLAAKAKRQKKAAKAAARAAREKERAEIEAAKASLARSGRAAKRAMAGA